MRRSALVLCTLFIAPSAAAQPALQWARKPVQTVTVDFGMAYDGARERLVLFGGTDGAVVRDETWEWDGSSWGLRTSVASPSARHGHRMVFDPAAARVVLFGGIDAGGGLRSDLWQWDGVEWLQRDTGSGPSPRLGHAMVYDPVRRSVVLFGGQDASGPLGDTWEWDGAQWVERFGAAPPARCGGAMAFDGARGVVVLFGGCTDGGSGSYLGDTWEWDGSTWTAAAPRQSPPALAAAELAYDPVAGRVVLFGGTSETPRAGSAATWEWDGADWTARSPSMAPPARAGFRMEWVADRRRIVAFGGSLTWGCGEFPAAVAPDTWEWDGDEWSLRTRAASPLWPGTGAAAYDEARQRIVVFKGRGTPATPETWEWDGAVWRVIPAAVQPSARDAYAIAYDPQRQRVVLFGGRGGSELGDTWEWDGTTWTEVETANAPPPRAGAAMAYDRARGEMLLFAGASGTFLDDTWSYDGADWTERQVSVVPGERLWHGMVYDEVRQVIVMFGGRDSMDLLGDTWEWDGSAWTMRAPPSAPGIRDGVSMYWDPVRGRVRFFGGTVVINYFDDTWEWDGETWVDVPTANPPPPRGFAATAYDRARDQLVIFSGFPPNADTYVLGAAEVARSSNYGRGCGGTNGVPQLAAFGRPVSGNAAFGLDVVAARGDSPFAVYLASHAGALALPGGCSVQLDPSSVFAAVGGAANASGFAHVPLPLPLGLPPFAFVAQAVVADAGSAIGVALTPGLGVTLGR